MDTTAPLHAYDLHLHHDERGTDRDALNRSAVKASRRRPQRHRFARGLRSVADRLDS